jgi:hypothetical protein
MITQERNECNFPRAKNMYLLVLVVEYFSDQGRVPMTALALEKSCCAESLAGNVAVLDVVRSWF